MAHFQFDDASKHFGLCGSAVVHMHGVGGRTDVKLRKHDLGVVRSLRGFFIIKYFIVS